MTNTELKNNIDAAITNKTSVSSITPSNVGEQIKSTVDYIDQEISNIELLEGPQGPIGPQGEIGPTGTATLPYKEYITLFGFLPDGNILEVLVLNTLTSTVSVTNEGTGVYQITSTNSFTSNKTFISPFGYQATTTDSGLIRLPIYSSNIIVGYYWVQRTGVNTVRLSFVDTSQNPINPFSLLGNRRLPVEIKVYN